MNPNESMRLRAELAHYRRSYSLLHEAALGEIVEYRRIFTPDRPAVFLESRVLNPDGAPYHDTPDAGPWYPVTGDSWKYLIYHAAQILGELCAVKEGEERPCDF